MPVLPSTGLIRPTSVITPTANLCGLGSSLPQEEEEDRTAQDGTGEGPHLRGEGHGILLRHLSGLLQEAGQMAEEYSMTLTPQMWTFAGAILGCSVLLFFLGKGRPKATKIRSRGNDRCGSDQTCAR